MNRLIAVCVCVRVLLHPCIRAFVHVRNVTPFRYLVGALRASNGTGANAS